VEWLISLAIIWGAAWINVRGSVNVTRVSIIAGCFVMLGFLVLSVASAPRSRTYGSKPVHRRVRCVVGSGDVGVVRRDVPQRNSGELLLLFLAPPIGRRISPSTSPFYRC
jgi:hypothetical protein